MQVSEKRYACTSTSTAVHVSRAHMVREKGGHNHARHARANATRLDTSTYAAQGETEYRIHAIRKCKIVPELPTGGAGGGYRVRAQHLGPPMRLLLLRRRRLRTRRIGIPRALRVARRLPTGVVLRRWRCSLIHARADPRDRVGAAGRPRLVPSDRRQRRGAGRLRPTALALFSVLNVHLCVCEVCVEYA